MDVPVRSFSVLMENVSHRPLCVTMMMTVETGVMKTLAVCGFFFPLSLNSLMRVSYSAQKKTKIKLLGHVTITSLLDVHVSCLIGSSPSVNFLLIPFFMV